MTGRHRAADASTGEFESTVVFNGDYPVVVRRPHGATAARWCICASTADPALNCPQHGIGGKPR